ncbi:type II toxin-antitoxin system HipA family toxin [Chlorobium sp.]|uniref:type II toxin-antitoxin system HipA family toxin n=1 Tax=Chlorobium sp. TaxID=1095 RepID=UPI002F41E21E
MKEIPSARRNPEPDRPANGPENGEITPIRALYIGNNRYPAGFTMHLRSQHNRSNPAMYRSVNRIEVRAWNRTVGAVTLDAASGCCIFEYDPSWQAGGIELAPLTMPLAETVHTFPLLPEAAFMRLPGLLADSIPDRFASRLIETYLAKEGLSPEAITPLDRLAYMGSSGMGALEFRPVRGPRFSKPKELEIDHLVAASNAALAGNFHNDREAEAGTANLFQVGTSAGGEQPKAVISWNEETDEIRSGQLPAGPGFEHWIIKLDGVGVEDEAANDCSAGRIEYAYSMMAKAAGIAMTECCLLEENGRAHFMTRRFDRREGEKLHMQSLCALRHLDFTRRDAHDYDRYFETAGALGLPETAMQEAFRRMVFNVLAANCDDHTRQLSFLMDPDGNWSLSPACGLTHAFTPYGEWKFRHRMSVNGKFSDSSREDFDMVGRRFTVPDHESIISEVAEAVGRWPEFAAAARISPEAALRIRQDFPDRTAAP